MTPDQPADVAAFDQRIEANAQRPSLAGYQALVADLRAALAGSGLDGAWAAAEAALPKGWSNGPTLFGYDVRHGGRSYMANVEDPRPHLRGRRNVIVETGGTPAAALRALAARLAEFRP